MKKQARSVVKYANVDLDSNASIDFIAKFHDYKSWKAAIKKERKEASISFPSSDIFYMAMVKKIKLLLNIDDERAVFIMSAIFGIKDPLLMRASAMGLTKRWNDFLENFTETNLINVINLETYFTSTGAHHGSITISEPKSPTTTNIDFISAQCLIAMICDKGNIGSTRDVLITLDKGNVFDFTVRISGVLMRCVLMNKGMTISLVLTKLIK